MASPRLCLCFLILTVLIGTTECCADLAMLTVTSDSVILYSDDSALSVSLDCPRFVIQGSQAVGEAPPSSIIGDVADGQPLTVTFPVIGLPDGAALEVQLFARLSTKEDVLRKWARFRLSGTTEPQVLNEVVLEDLDVTDRAADIPPPSLQSYPVLLRGFFAGIEFPVAATRRDGSRLLLAYRPGLRMQPGVWYETRKAVYGIAAPGDEKRAFQRYIAAHRPGPTGLHINYNSWWTSPVPYTERDILDLIGIFRDNLYHPYRASFDTFCIDMGWSDSHSVWGIDAKLFPAGFTKLQQALAAMNGHLGLWISPTSCYAFALDNNWAKENGYETFAMPWGDTPQRFACLGGVRYRTAFQQRLIDMVTRYGIRHVKLDGYLFECPESGHGHEPGPLSSEAIAQGFITVADAVRKAAPDVWLEPTCFGPNPSPWWLFHFNSVTGSFGDDAPWGRVPAPVYRESYTTARDFFNLQGAYWDTAPVAAQEVLGIVHQTTDPYLNDAVMTLMRGHMFLPVYLNPSYMTERRWRDLADLITWARRNAPLLQDTLPLLPASWTGGKCPQFTGAASMPREPYGYAHWRSDGGIIALRNPWIRPTTFMLTLDSDLRVPGDTRGFDAVSIYPETRAYGRGLRPGETLRVPLAPYETVVLSVTAADAPRATPTVRQVLRRCISTTVRTRQLDVVTFEGPAEAFGPDWTSLVGDAARGVRLQLDADIENRAPQAELLVLVEDKALPSLAICHVTVDGRERAVIATGSENGWAACGQPKPEHWAFYRVPLKSGKQNVRVELTIGGATPIVSAWVWATKPGTSHTAPRESLPTPEVISLDARALLEPRDGSTLPASQISIPRPVERITGTFLDSLEPTSVSQGWGTLQKNRSVWEKPMTIAGQRYLRGLGTHAPSRIVFDLDGAYRRFQSWVGADAATAPTIAFEVWTDGQKRWESGLMRREDAAKRVDIDIAGVKRLELAVTDGGNGINADHADWADARLVR